MSRDEIIVINISDMPSELVGKALGDIDRIRPLIITPAEARGFLESQIAASYNSLRGQVNGRELIKRVNESGIGKFVQPGKLIIINEDLYYPSTGWVFGGYTPTSDGRGLSGGGYILLSTARARVPELATDILRHELGHMFGAPSEGRTNTAESLGLHCVNDICVMQQKLTLAEAVRYAKQRASAGASTYCAQCEADIQRYVPGK